MYKEKSLAQKILYKRLPIQNGRKCNRLEENPHFLLDPLARQLQLCIFVNNS